MAFGDLLTSANAQGEGHGATTASATFAASVPSGYLMFANWRYPQTGGSPPTVADATTGSWTVTHDILDGGGGLRGGCAWKVNTSSGAHVVTLTVPVSSFGIYLLITAFEGPFHASPLDQEGTVNPVDTSPATSASITPTVNGSLLLLWDIRSQDDGGGISASNGFGTYSRTHSSEVRMGLRNQVQTTAAAISSSISGGAAAGAQDWGIGILSFKPAGGSTPGGAAFHHYHRNLKPYGYGL